MGHLVEEVFDEMTKELDWVLKATCRTLRQHGFNNGYATYLPRNTIVIYVTARGTAHCPTMKTGTTPFSLTSTHSSSGYHWITCHRTCHLWTVAMMNGLSPNWVVEGQATMQETWQSNTGRGRGAIPDMIKRTMTIEGHFPPLGNMDGYQTSNPSGNLRYLFGQDFMNYIAEQTHEQVWTEWNHTYGGGIPYWLPSKQVFGQRFPELYQDWKSSLEDRYAKQVQAITKQGLSEYTLLSEEGRNCMEPIRRWQQNGIFLLLLSTDHLSTSSTRWFRRV